MRKVINYSIISKARGYYLGKKNTCFLFFYCAIFSLTTNLVFSDDTSPSRSDYIKAFNEAQRCYNSTYNASFVRKRDCAKRALEAGRFIFEPGSLNIAALTYNYGNALDRRDEKLDVLGQALELYEAIYGKSSLEVIDVLIDMGATRKVIAIAKKYFEKDAALTRRFQPVFVNEPSSTDAVAILRGLKEKYEIHHGIRISDEAILAAVQLSDRYITDRFLPDKAIDLMDEAASKVKMEIDSKPEEIDQLDRDLIKLQMEKNVLSKDSEQDEKKNENINKQIQELEEKLKSLNATWEAEKKILDTKRNLNERIDQAKEDLEAAQRNGDLTKASEIMYGLLPDLQKEYNSLNEQEQSKIINEVINSEDIAGVVSKWTGIPLEKLSSGENNKLVNIEQLLEKRVIGQNDAIEKVSKAIKISKAGLQDPNKPLGSFLFLGPTGVGKTELSKALAEYVFDNEKQMLRLDMSEYMEKHSVSKLIGSPPGYVGYDDGGKLTDSVRRRPYQVILFDEIEKAHPDVFNILLQILDDGRLTDSKGKIVNFKNTLIIMTSNIGSQIPIDDNFDYATKKNLALEELKNHFRLEFLNRIDDIILFNKLSKENINHILQNQIDIIQDRISSKGIKISFSDEALEFLSEKGFDPIFGARPLKRLLQDEVLNPLSEVILELGENISEKIIFTKDKYGLKIANKDLKVLSS